MTNIKNHRQTLIILALLIINFVLKGIFLAANSLGGDEPFSVYFAQMDIASIIRLLSEGNNPPLFEIILHFWTKIFGISEFSVRFPSLIFSCITVYYLYKIGIKYFNERIALYSGIIFTFSNYHILFAHEARVYSLLGMLTAISIYLFIGILHDFLNSSETDNDKGSTRRMTKKVVILAFVNTLLIYSHYFGFFVIIVELLYLLIFNFPLLVKYWKQVLLCTGIILTFYFPFVLVVLNRLAESSHGTWVSPPNGIQSIYNMLWSFSNAPVVTVFVISVLIISLSKSLFARKKESKDPYFSFIVFCFLFIFLFMFGISYWLPMFLDRYLMPGAIAFILVLGICIDTLIKTPKYKYIVPAIICILFISTFKPDKSNKRNVRETVEKITNIRDSNTLVLICPSNFILDFVYYYNRDYFKDYNNNDIYLNASNHLKKENIYAINNIDDINFKKWERVIFLDAAADFVSPDNNIRVELEENYHLRNSYKFYEIYNIYEYTLE